MAGGQQTLSMPKRPSSLMVAVAQGAQPTSRLVCETSAVLVARHPAKRPRTPLSETRLAWRQRNGRAGWSGFDLGFASSLVAIFLLNLLDITVTLVHTGRVGWVAEANGLIRFMAESGGAWVASCSRSSSWAAP